MGAARVAASGGLPEVLPVPYGEFGAISPDGSSLAYPGYATWLSGLGLDGSGVIVAHVDDGLIVAGHGRRDIKGDRAGCRIVLFEFDGPAVARDFQHVGAALPVVIDRHRGRPVRR